MSFDQTLLLLPIIFVAYFLKATTGFGSALVIVAGASVIVGPVNAVILVAFLDIVGGFALLRLDQTPDHARDWLAPAVAMVVGAAAGALLLKQFSIQGFEKLLGVVLIIAGLALIFLRRIGTLPQGEMPTGRPYSARDAAVCMFAGACGGLTGLSGPPVIFYFGRRLVKESFRRVLTRIFLAEAVARSGVYAVTGLADPRLLLGALLGVPFLLAGLFAGNRVFLRIPEPIFGWLIGLAVVVLGARLII